MDTKKKKILELLEFNAGNISDACMSANIARSTFYNWYNADIDFKTEVENIREGVIDFVESKLMNAIKDDNITAIIFFLKTRAKHRGYSERSEFNVRSNMNIPILNIDPLDDETPFEKILKVLSAPTADEED